MRDKGEMCPALLVNLAVNAGSIFRKLFDTGPIASREPSWARLMIKSAATRLKQASSDPMVVRPGPNPWSLRARKRTREAFAAAVGIAGWLMISSTAPALLEGANTRAIDIHGKDNPGLDGYGALLTGDSYQSADILAAAGAASSSLTEAYPLAGSHSCDKLRENNMTLPATGDSASALRTRGGFCFGPHDVIEYYALHRNSDRRSVDISHDGVPSTVRSPIADNQLFQDLPSVVATADDDDDEFREPSRPSKVSPQAKSSTAPTAHARGASRLRPVGCSRCPGQVAQSSPRRAKSFAVVLAMDFFRNARSVRRERLPSGVARQRETPRVAVWYFRRG
jgi:hypothetical protein